MNSEPIEVAGHQYRVARKMDAMVQFHCTRRLGPALAVCGVTIKMVLEGVAVPPEQLAVVAGPVMEVVSKMTDEDVEYVIFACMRCVERFDGQRWAPVLALTPHGDGRALMFQDIEQAELIRLTIEVLRDNLVNFARGLSAGGSTSAAAASGSAPQA